jgi:hypothetical protein
MQNRAELIGAGANVRYDRPHWQCSAARQCRPFCYRFHGMVEKAHSGKLQPAEIDRRRFQCPAAKHTDGPETR